MGKRAVRGKPHRAVHFRRRADHAGVGEVCRVDFARVLRRFIRRNGAVGRVINFRIRVRGGKSDLCRFAERTARRGESDGSYRLGPRGACGFVSEHLNFAELRISLTLTVSKRIAGNTNVSRHNRCEIERSAAI